jgi:dipeptidyl aminopeptidase/acylaminoacyl peptidase
MVLFNLIDAQRWNLTQHKSSVTSVAFSPDGLTMVSTSLDGTVLVWNTITHEPMGPPFQDHNGAVNGAAFSPDGKTVASCGKDGNIILREITGGQTVIQANFAGHNAEVTTIAFSPDGKRLASCAIGDRRVILWDVDRKEKAAELPHRSSVMSITFSPDGKILASGTRTGKLILWDICSREQRPELINKHKGAIRATAFSIDGMTLASASEDKTAALWDVATGQPLGQLFAESGQPIRSLAFSPDGETLALGSAELSFSDVGFEDMKSRASNIAARNLTEKEWKRFLGDEPPRFTSLEGALLEAHRLALAGQELKAEQAFKELVQCTIQTKDQTLNNHVGWYGSLDGFAEIVLPACEAAVRLVVERQQPRYRRLETLHRDTRGVARAFLRDIAGAIEDFQAVLEWAAQNNQQDQAMPEEWVRRRKAWLSELKAGRNPLDTATLKALLREVADLRG